tara:strand:- start:25766 stop:26107 length:342 start_codon:yes stop_codon:yes gene_type:complete
MTLLTSLVHPGLWQIFGQSPDSFRIEGVANNPSITVTDSVAVSKVTDTTKGGSGLKKSKAKPASEGSFSVTKQGLFTGGVKKVASLEIDVKSVSTIHNNEVKKYNTNKGKLNV